MSLIISIFFFKLEFRLCVDDKRRFQLIVDTSLLQTVPINPGMLFWDIQQLLQVSFLGHRLILRKKEHMYVHVNLSRDISVRIT